MARRGAMKLYSIRMATRGGRVWMAVDAARHNPAFPFGGVIVRVGDGEVLAAGANRSHENPTLHGEVAAIHDYVARNGHQGWDEAILYTTGEPCPMCMSAIIWAGIGGVVYATSIAGLKAAGFHQIDVVSAEVARTAPFWNGAIRGGVLAPETDRMFAERPRG